MKAASTWGGMRALFLRDLTLAQRRGLEVFDVQERRPVEPDVDERSLHPGKYSGNSTEVDVSHRRAMMPPLDVELAEHTVRDETNARFSDVDVDQKCVFRHSCIR